MTLFLIGLGSFLAGGVLVYFYYAKLIAAGKYAVEEIESMAKDAETKVKKMF